MFVEHVPFRCDRHTYVLDRQKHRSKVKHIPSGTLRARRFSQRNELEGRVLFCCVLVLASAFHSSRVFINQIHHGGRSVAALTMSTAAWIRAKKAEEALFALQQTPEYSALTLQALRTIS